MKEGKARSGACELCAPSTHTCSAGPGTGPPLLEVGSLGGSPVLWSSLAFLVTGPSLGIPEPS